MISRSGVHNPQSFLHPAVNPRLILRLNKWSIYQVKPPCKRHLNSLISRDESLKRFKRIWYQDYLLSLREHTPKHNYADWLWNLSGWNRDNNKTGTFWGLGRVTHHFPGDYVLVRSALIKRGDGFLQVHTLKHLHHRELSIQGPFNHPGSLLEDQDNSIDHDVYPSILMSW